MKGQRCRPRRTPLPLPHNHPLPVTQLAARELGSPGEGGAVTATQAPGLGRSRLQQVRLLLESERASEALTQEEEGIWASP